MSCWKWAREMNVWKSTSFKNEPISILVLTKTQNILCLLTGGLEAQHLWLVGGYILLVSTFELVNQVIRHMVIKVFPIQVGVTSFGFYFKDVILDVLDRHIKGATTQIKDQYMFLFFKGFVLFFSNPGHRHGCYSRFINDSQDIKISDGSCILGGLTLNHLSRLEE